METVYIFKKEQTVRWNFENMRVAALLTYTAHKPATLYTV